MSDGPQGHEPRQQLLYGCFRSRAAVFTVVWGLGGLSACATGGLAPAPGDVTALIISCTSETPAAPLPGALLYIDDVYIGRVQTWGDPAAPRFIRPGAHRLEVRHPGYFTRYAELTARPGDALKLAFVLVPELDADLSGVPTFTPR